MGFTLGRHLSDFAKSHAEMLCVEGFYSRNPESAREAARFTGTKYYEDMETLVQACDTIFLTVPDGQIANVAEEIAMKVIARIHTDFPEKFGIPRQSGLIEELKSTIVFEPEFRDANALRGLEEYSHLWLIWEFSEAVRDTWSPMVPRLGGNKRVGVFATRSPFRPNPIGLSSVKLEYVEQHPSLGPVLHLTGADLMDGTPILDIKPYLPHVDSHVEALGSFTEKTKEYFIPVEIPDELLEKVPADHRAALKKVLEQDPRPSYQNSEERVYGLSFAGMEIKFQVKDEVLHVVGVEM